MGILQLRQLFALESQDTLQQMEDALLQLENNPNDKETINVLFRTAHTIKGSAGVVGLDDISSFTHTMENVLEKVRSGQLQVTEELIQLMLACHDHVGKMLEQVTEQDAGGEQQAQDPAVAEESKQLTNRLQDYFKAMIAGAATSKTEHRGEKSPASLKKPSAEKGTPIISATAGAKTTDKLARIFTKETKDMLDEMAKILNVLEENPQRSALAEEVYRTFHTLKGSAGLVGFQPLVDFSQKMETLLEKVLPISFSFSPILLAILRECHAHAEELLIYFSSGAKAEELPALQAKSQNLLQHLETEFTQTLKSLAAEGGETAITILNRPVAGEDNWHISMRFKEDALHHGVDPLASIRYLYTLGEIIILHTLFDNMPLADEMDPENCYLGFELEFRSSATKEEIESMFELVHEHCRIHILPPHSQLTHYIQLIHDLPEDTMKLGEILIESGTLTARELEEGLTLQAAQRQLTPPDELQPAAPRIGEILVDSGLVQPEIVTAALHKQQQVLETKTHLQKTIQVDAEKLDQLINLVGELVIANASINLLMQGVSNDRLKEATSLMSRLVEDIRNSSLRMRMVHIGGTFNRFRRLVHDISRDLGKKIDLVISGSDTELDKSMVEKINDPLMHLVRNAIDHGIESEEKRAAKGKPLAGTVQLNAYHDSGSIVIEVSDDGAGLDRDKILAKAIEKGLVKPGEELTEQEIDALVFEPGFSTAKLVTQLSGRGVGMDVVKRNINALNGTVDIKSTPGVGMTVQIFLPLTLAIIDGFLLTIGSSSFVVPLDRVVECVEFSQDRQQAMQSGYLNLRGKVLPLLRLRDLFKLSSTEELPRENIVIVHYGNQEAGLVVDELLGEFQAVIKPLGKIFEKLPGVSGATILGNGEVALILDIPELVKKYAKQDQKKRQVVRELAHI